MPRTRTRTPAAQLALSFDAPPSPAPIPVLPPRPAADTQDRTPLAVALAHHALIEGALRDGGPNPLPLTLDDDEWEEELGAFESFGPLESTLLQEAEARIEALVEFLPEYWPDEDQDDEPAPPAWTGLLPGETDPWDDYAARGFPAVEYHLPQEPETQPQPTAPADQCLRIYADSLPDLTEEELRVDLLAALASGRADTAALIEAELGAP